jgi:multidrug efflux system membrane fusion protein
MPNEDIYPSSAEPPTPPDHQLPAHAGEAGKREPRKSRFLIWLLVILLFAGLFWWVLHSHQSANSAAAARRMMGGPVTVTAAPVTVGDVPVYLDAIGTVTPVYTDSIVSQVNGQVISVHYKEGQLVHKGDPLVDIDPRPYKATLLQAEGTLEKDTQVLAQARMDLDRYQKAWAHNAIAKQILDDQEKIVLQDEGTVKNDQGTVQYDEVQVGFCHITAPITGRVGLRLVDPGNVVTSSGSTTLAVITQLQPITVVFTVSEDNLPQVLSQPHHGNNLPVTALDRAQSKEIADGKLLTTDNQIDTTTGTVKLRALFDNKNEGLFPNQFVNTRLQVDTLHNALSVPSSAIQHNGNVAFVYLVKKDNKGQQTAQVQNVTTGVTDGNMTQVVGLGSGELVANSSFQNLQPGSKVMISKTPMAQTTSTTGSMAP